MQFCKNPLELYESNRMAVPAREGRAQRPRGRRGRARVPGARAARGVRGRRGRRSINVRAPAPQHTYAELPWTCSVPQKCIY